MSRDFVSKVINVLMKWPLIIAGSVFFLCPGRAASEDLGMQNFRKMKYGLFVHYVWGGKAYTATVNANGSAPAGLDDLAENFDAERFANDLASINVEYVIFTAWHANMNCLWPSPKMQRWLAGHASSRDVLREMITAVHAKGVRVLLYTHPSDGHDLTLAEQAATGWGPNFDRTRWNDFINDIYGDLVFRYGKDILGIYIDEHGGNNAQYVDYERLRHTIKAANPNLLLLQNDYGHIYNCDLGDQEDFNFDSTDGDTWPALGEPSSVLLSQNWWASETEVLFAPKYSPESVFRYTVIKAGVCSSAGGTAWAAGCYPGGGWEKGVLETMRGVRDYIRPIGCSLTNTYASTSFVTVSGATIQSLEWGVATCSTDGRREFIHVLTPPNGKTLHLPPPADRKIFGSARLLVNGHEINLVQNEFGLSLTLRNEDSWQWLDTVIELTVCGKSALPMNVIYKGERPASLTAISQTSLPPPKFGETSILAPAPGMVRWFDAASLKLTNGAPVAYWADSSGNQADAFCPAGGNTPPTYVANAKTGTGFGAIHFGPGDGLNPALNSQTLVFRTDTKIRTVFSVFKGSGFLLTDYGAIHFHRPDDTNAASPLWGGAYSSPSILGGKTYVNGIVVNGATFSMPTNLHNGFNLVEVFATNAITASGFNKDRVCHAGDQYQAEVVIYDFSLNDAQRLQTEAYLKAKWFGEKPSPAGDQ